MSDYDNNMRGAIWKNDRKEKETQPDFTGELLIDGVEYWVSAWKRKPDAKPKAPALSFAVKPKDEAHKQGSQQARKAVDEPQPGDVALGPDDYDDIDGLPF